MAEASINDVKRGYYAAALGYTLGQAMEKSISDLEYEFFQQTPPVGLPAPGPSGQYLRSTGTAWTSQTAPGVLSQVQAESPADTTAGYASGQRLSQATIANLKAITGYGASKTLKVNAAGTGFEWVA